MVPFTNKIIAVIFIVAISFISCKKDNEPGTTSDMAVEGNDTPTLPNNPYDYASAYDYPDHITDDPLLALFTGGFDPNISPITNDGATLGRVLFYDKKLSINDEIACASCHHQENAFSDPETFSTGVFGQSSNRNSMGFQNMRFTNRMFWDHRVFGLENQISFPIQDPTEMGMPMDSLLPKLSDISYYPELFTKAFGDDEITEDRIASAMAQFIHSINTYNSKYDIEIENDFANFTELEMEGMNLYFGGQKRCNHCHSTQNFYSREAMNNGLDEVYEDEGQFLATGNPNDIGEFRVPSLRNIAVTAPYMHDGRFATLDEVLEHYSSGVKSHPNLNDRITTDLTTGGTPVHLNLTDQEKLALIAFLNTLTDEEMLTDAKFSSPF